MRFIRLLFIFQIAIAIQAQDVRQLQLDVRKPGSPIQKTMYGIFFEDINYGADGGLYAEMIKNRSFEFPQNLMGWKSFGTVEVRTDNAPFANNPHYVRLTDPVHRDKHTGLDNEGFFGISLKANQEYRFSVWARTSGDNATEEIRVEILDPVSNVITSSKLVVDSKDWKKYSVKLSSKRTESHGTIRLFLTSKGSLDLEHVSLFPTDTWKGRENGLRTDLAQALYDLKPGVFRFPGGCIVEGTDIETRYQWKNTIGAVENRKLNENRWHYTFTHRFFPDYYQTYGLGFYEYFLLSEDIGAEPLPVLNCGLACQFQNNEAHQHIAVCDLQPYIQDALDLIEFANGDSTTQWGKVRAQMGHPAPFGLKLLAIGNEQWGSEYPERLLPFVKAIRAKHPEIKLIGSSGPSPDGKDFDNGWAEMKKLKADLVDEHYYKDPEWFLKNAGRYDAYNRKGPKVFAGEYACHPKNRKNNFESALCEAAFMTGLERNADVVQMCTYAPLFAHVQGWQWRPDMIWFDNLRSVRTPNYYVQQLYAHNVGTNVLSLTENKLPLTGQKDLYASAVVDKKSNKLIIKIVNTADKEQQINIALNGIKSNLLSGTQTVFLHAIPDSENTLDKPNEIMPVTSVMKVENKALQVQMKPKSFQVLSIQL